MNANLQRSYRSKNGNVTFVYAVTGSPADLEAFKKAQGEFHREDDHGVALWFTTKCIGDRGKLIITTNGKVVPDMSAYDKASSLAAQFGGNLGQELARQAASALLGKSMPEPESAPVAVTPAVAGDLDVADA